MRPCSLTTPFLLLPPFPPLARVYFQPAELNNVGEPMKSFPLKGVIRAFKRR